MHPIKRLLTAALLVLSATIALADHHKAAEKPDTKPDGDWIQLFNGKDLTGWTPKFAGHELGVDVHNVFRAENGELRANYQDYPGDFKGDYGHLFYKTPYSHYRIRAEYRMIGDQLPAAPGWARANNGFMLHCQAPETMPLDQSAPDSIEAQMLAANPGEDRCTANICTPGTHVVIDGEPIKKHVIKSNGPSFPQDEWVTFEVEVRGDHFKHIVNGEVVHDYHARKDPFESGVPLTKGYIAIQAETGPTQFRKIELMILSEN